MPLLKIMGFDGVIPRTSATMLQDSQGQVANNVKMSSRELRYWRGPTMANSPAMTSIQTIYKYYTAAPDAVWLTWQTDVNVVQSPSADTTDYRLYYTGDGVPKKTTSALSNTGPGPYPADWRNMGVPAPAAAPTAAAAAFSITTAVVYEGGNAYTVGDVLTIVGGTHTVVCTVTVSSIIDDGSGTGPVAGVNITAAGTYTVLPDATATTTGGTGTGAKITVGAGTAESRAYLYTYISVFGSVTEESAPSAASNVITVYGNNSVTINGFTNQPTSNYNITGIRIYRTITGDTTASYEFVTEITTATASGASYGDTLTAAQLGVVLPTLGWLPPPSDLAGLISHPSGALVGFSGNTVYFSQPYYPHAWPLAYAVNVPSKIVAIGVFGTSVVVATERYPHIISGTYPGVMSAERVPILEPCVSKPSLFSDEFGVVYASNNGLVGIGPNMRGIVTTDLFAPGEFINYHPDLLAGVVINNQYFAIYPNNGLSLSSMVLNRNDIPAMSFTSMKASAIHVDSRGGKLYYCNSDDGKIYQWDATELTPLDFEWKSKRFVLPQGSTFSALKLDADFSQIGDTAAYNAEVAALAAANQLLFGSNMGGVVNGAAVDVHDVDGGTMATLPQLATNRGVVVTVYGDGALMASLTITTFDPVRLPPFRSRSLEVDIAGNVNVRSVALATTVTELHQL